MSDKTEKRLSLFSLSDESMSDFLVFSLIVLSCYACLLLLGVV